MASPMDEGNLGATSRITRRSFLRNMGLGAAALSLGALPTRPAAANWPPPEQP